MSFSVAPRRWKVSSCSETPTKTNLSADLLPTWSLRSTACCNVRQATSTTIETVGAHTCRDPQPLPTIYGQNSKPAQSGTNSHIPSHEWFTHIRLFSEPCVDPKHRLFEENVLAELGGADVSFQAMNPMKFPFFVEIRIVPA